MTSIIIVTALFLGFSFSLTWTLGYKEKVELSGKLAEKKDEEKKLQATLEKAKAEAEKNKKALTETEEKLAFEAGERKKAEEERKDFEEKLLVTEERCSQDEIEAREKFKVEEAIKTSALKKEEIERLKKELTETESRTKLKIEEALLLATKKGKDAEQKLVIEADERKKAEEARLFMESRLRLVEEEKRRLEEDVKIRMEELRTLTSVSAETEKKKFELEELLKAETDARKQAEQKWLLAETKRSIAEKEAIERIKMEERLRVSAEAGEEIERLRIELAEAREEAKLASNMERMKIDSKKIDALPIEKEKIVANAREELTRIAESIEVMAQSKDRDIESLKPALKQLDIIAENLKVAGLDKAGNLAMREQKILAVMAEGTVPMDEKSLKNVAGMMRNIEFVTGAYVPSNSKLLTVDIDEARFAGVRLAGEDKIRTESLDGNGTARVTLVEKEVKYTELTSTIILEKGMTDKVTVSSNNPGQKDTLFTGRSKEGDFWWTEEVIKYRVMKGNTLSLIAAQKYIYDDWRKWSVIYKHNMHIIKNPNIIYPGQILIIPRISERNNEKRKYTDYIAKGS